MLNISKESGKSPKDVLDRAVEFFGPGGAGLEIRERSESCALFVGGGGHVFVQTCERNGGSEVDVVTREWEYQVREFLGKI